ncbi:hypothetical protein Tco_0545723 [Tanacetum coccineum]
MRVVVMMMTMVMGCGCRRGGREKWRVEESGSGDRVDPEVGSVFGLRRKSPPEKFSGGGEWGPAVVGFAGEDGGEGEQRLQWHERRDWGNKCKIGDQTINWFGYETTFEKEFKEFCKSNSKSKNDNDVDGDFWANYNPHDEWVHMKSEETDPTKIFQEKIKDHKLIVTNDELMHYAGDCMTWKHKINGKPQRMTRKFDDEFDKWVEINGWLMKK